MGTVCSNGHGHTHEHMENPGEFDKRDPPLDESKRNWDERAFTVGIGGPVGRWNPRTQSCSLVLCAMPHGGTSLRWVLPFVF
jgi:hypothetical protein